MTEQAVEQPEPAYVSPGAVEAATGAQVVFPIPQEQQGLAPKAEEAQA